MENLSKILCLILFLSSCSLTSYYVEPIYEDHPHTTEVYWYTDYELGGTPYFGYWDNFYYYYGVPHFYPWWSYYQFIPPYHYFVNTHIIILILYSAIHFLNIRRLIGLIIIIRSESGMKRAAQT